jgi:hypothetical protein
MRGMDKLVEFLNCAQPSLKLSDEIFGPNYIANETPFYYNHYWADGRKLLINGF